MASELEDLPGVEPEEKDLETAPEGEQTDGLIADDAAANELDETVEQDIGRALRIAARDKSVTQIGVVEGPANDQQGYGHYFGNNFKPWCAYFASWCYDQAGNRDRRVPWGAGYAGAIYEWGRANNMLASVPASGDIVIFTDFSHCGIVRGVDQTNGPFNSVDGNWSDRVSYVLGRNFRTTRYYFVRPNLATV